jgi:rhamnulokinase
MNHLAIDIGASGGRAILGSFDGERVALKEVHRFENGPISLPGGLFWNAPQLLAEVGHGIRRAVDAGAEIHSIGVDTWAVDYALLAKSGDILGLPHHYRDPRTRGLIDEIAGILGRERLYETTGIQFQEFNTLVQLYAERRADPRRLEIADRLLFFPDLLHYWLTGDASSEPTNASTSQFFDPRKMTFATDLLKALEIPTHFLPELRPPGSTCGPLRADFAAASGVPSINVVRPATHDTASAVLAVPGIGDDWAFISCGTWSLVGVEIEKPITTIEAMNANFTNEVGRGGKIRFLKNIGGLFLLQECRRAWSSNGRGPTWDEIEAAAESSSGRSSIIDPDDPSLFSFGDMPQKVRRSASKFGDVPQSIGEIAACILRSMALKHRQVIREIEATTRRKISVIHLVGGGSRMNILARWTADATEKPVMTGPVEATAIGNVLAQAFGSAPNATNADIRAVVRRSFELAVFEPRADERWDRDEARLAALRERRDG